MLKTLLIAGIMASGAASANEAVIRHPIPGSDFPIAEAVSIRAGSDLVFVSGAVPRAVVEGGDPADPATFGDTEAQTKTVLEAISARLERAGMGPGDVVMMRVYLVGDPKFGGRMDFAGLMRGYSQFYGTPEQPNLPARSAIQVAGLAQPGWLVEIDVVAAKAPAAPTKKRMR